MAHVKPKLDDYIHFIQTNGLESYGWYRGAIVDTSLPGEKSSVVSGDTNHGVDVKLIAAWRPVYKP